MSGNINPIYSRVGNIGGSPIITAAANDYNGQNANNVIAYTADPTNGSYIQRLRFKVAGTGNTVATVARVYVNNGKSHLATTISAVSGTPTGTASGSDSTLPACSLFAKVYAVDQYGSVTAASTETASVTVTATQHVAWAWTAVSGASSYIIAVGSATGAQQVIFTSATNAYTQLTPGTPTGPVNPVNQWLHGEISLPAVTSIATAATAEIDYLMDYALDPGFCILVGLGTAVTAGWQISAICGKY